MKMKRNADLLHMLEDRQLGSLEAEYTSEKITAPFAINIGLIGLLISLLIDLLFIIFANHSDFSLFWSNLLPISAFIESIFYLVLLGVVVSTIGIHVFFCKEGFLYIRGGRKHDIKWKAIHRVERTVSDDPNLLFPIPFFTIVSRDGRSFTFRDPDGGLLDAFKARSIQHGFSVSEPRKGKGPKQT